MALEEKKTIEVASGIFFDIDPEKEYIEVRIGNEKRVISKSELWGVAYVIADPDTQDKLTPVRTTEMMTFEKIHRVRVTKPIAKGQILRVKCLTNVPVTVTESLKGLVDPRK